jgi:hypothetical protein
VIDARIAQALTPSVQGSPEGDADYPGKRVDHVARDDFAKWLIDHFEDFDGTDRRDVCEEISECFCSQRVFTTRLSIEKRSERPSRNAGPETGTDSTRKRLGQKYAQTSCDLDSRQGEVPSS